MDENLLALINNGLLSGAQSSLSGSGTNAASLASLLGAGDLNTFAQQAQQSDLMGQLAPVVADTRFDRSNWDLGTSFGTSLGQAMLAGYLGNQSRANTAEQVSKVSQVLPSLYSNPLGTAAPEGVDANAWESLKTAATVKNLQREALGKTKQQDTLRKLMEEIYGTDISAMKVGKETAAKISAENEAYGYKPAVVGEGGVVPTLPSSYDELASLNPNSPQYKQAKDLIDSKRDVESKDSDRLVNLRKEFNALEPVKNFAKATQAATALSGALKDKNSVSDQELVRYSILMIEPGMAVREGEQNAMAYSQSIPDSMRGDLLKAWKGESRLSDPVREGIKRLAERAYNSHKGLYEQSYGLYSKEAEMQGFDPKRISYMGEAPDVSSVFGSSTSINGANYQKVNGGWKRVN